jgi:hypothetical protein
LVVLGFELGASLWLDMRYHLNHSASPSFFS